MAGHSDSLDPLPDFQEEWHTKTGKSLVLHSSKASTGRPGPNRPRM